MRSQPVSGPSWRNPNNDPWVAFSSATLDVPFWTVRVSDIPLGNDRTQGRLHERSAGKDRSEGGTGMVEETVAMLGERGYATIPAAIGPEQVAWARTDLEEILTTTPSGRDDFEGR